MNPIAPFLHERGIVILDGALATELERRGADLRDPLWSAKLLLDNPESIRQLHLDYFRAGADVATTASYQATIPGLMARGLSESQAADVLRLSVTLARQARDDFRAAQPASLAPLVAASIGCYGAYLHDGSEYRGDYGLSVPELIAWHRPRLEILASSGADLLACETVPCLAEGEALAKLLGEFAATPAWLSFSCRDERSLRHGEPFADAVVLANEAANIVAVGVNCTAPEHVDGLLAIASALTRKPLVVYPNSGETWDAAGRCWGNGAAELDWAAAARRWRDLGARLIGGCCRTTPDTIRRIAEALRPSRAP